MAKRTEPKCKNCMLFNKADSTCKVVILHEGERHHLPVEPNDDCFFENEFTAINEEGEKESFKVGVEQVRWWVEDPKTGQPTKKENEKGIVKIEYPEGFFGKEKD